MEVVLWVSGLTLLALIARHVVWPGVAGPHDIMTKVTWCDLILYMVMYYVMQSQRQFLPLELQYAILWWPFREGTLTQFSKKNIYTKLKGLVWSDL
jgi:hypothetical protein